MDQMTLLVIGAVVVAILAFLSRFAPWRSGSRGGEHRDGRGPLPGDQNVGSQGGPSTDTSDHHTHHGGGHHGGDVGGGHHGGGDFGGGGGHHG